MQKKCDCPSPEEFNATVEEHIERAGHSVVGVHDEPGVSLGFAYTVGLTLKGVPELIISMRNSLPAAQMILNLVARALTEENSTTGIRLGKREDLFNVPVYLQELQLGILDTHMLNVKKRYGVKARVIQVIWVDKDGLLPGERSAPNEADQQQDLFRARLLN